MSLLKDYSEQHSVFGNCNKRDVNGKNFNCARELVPGT